MEARFSHEASTTVPKITKAYLQLILLDIIPESCDDLRTGQNLCPHNRLQCRRQAIRRLQAWLFGFALLLVSLRRRRLAFLGLVRLGFWSQIEWLERMDMRRNIFIHGKHSES